MNGNYEAQRREDMERWQEYEKTGAFVSQADMNRFFDDLIARAVRAQRKESSDCQQD